MRRTADQPSEAEGPASAGPRADEVQLTERPAISLRTKLLFLFVPLTLLFPALLLLATREASGIRRSLARVFEEEREAELSSALLVELRGAESWAGRSGAAASAAEIERDLVGHLERARDLVVQLDGIPEHDPSEPEHEEREDTLRQRLFDALSAARSSAGDERRATVVETLRSVRRLAEVLVNEARREADRAAADLDEAARDLVNMLLLVAVSGSFTIVVLLVGFRAHVLKPLDALRRAAKSFGRGAPHEPVGISARDEFGLLARTFDRMAARLERNRAELETMVRERTAEVARSARLADLGRLAAGIAHEINTPLATIAAGVEGLRREVGATGDVGRNVAERAALIVSEAQRAREISSRLLRLGRHEGRKVEPVWLAEIARETVAIVAWEAGRRNVLIEVREDPDVPPIRSDANEWRQIMLNLLHNALDAAPPHSAIDVVITADAQALAFAVRDRGAGFPAEVRERAFEPFFTTKPAGEGTGLGLTIVERLVHESGGEVSVGNWAEGGQVLVRIPRAACA